MIKVLQLRFSR